MHDKSSKLPQIVQEYTARISVVKESWNVLAKVQRGRGEFEENLKKGVNL